MKHVWKRVSSLLMACMMLMGLTTTAFAAVPDVVLELTGSRNGVSVSTEGSDYTDTDLFHDFKDVMPGNKLETTIEIVNNVAGFDYGWIYMRAIVHDEEENPLTYSEAFENEDSKDQANVDGARDETVATMQEFLSRLTMTIKHGDTTVFADSPDEPFNPDETYRLVKLDKGHSATITVELDVPIELDNEFSNRVGEVDWEFIFEGRNNSSGGDPDPVSPQPDPEPPTPDSDIPDTQYLTVKKVWSGDQGQLDKRPGAVSIVLYDGMTPVETITLNVENGWTYTWSNLDPSKEWGILEKNVKGYSPSYAVDGQIITVTNTATLIQTGQLNWPVPILGGLGVLMLAFGAYIVFKKRKTDRA